MPADKAPADITVSIHAPLKGATIVYDAMEIQGIVSIHAPLKGATRDGIMYPIGF